MIKAIIFDFYGVLYKNFDWFEINDRIYSDPKKRIEFRGYVDKINTGHMRDDKFRKVTAKLAEDKKNVEHPAVYSEPIVDDRLAKFINELPKGLRTACFSNGNKLDVLKALSKHGYDNLFDLVVVSSELPTAKPDPEAFREVVSRLGEGINLKPEEVIIVDDSPRHVDGAKTAGYRTIKYDDFDSFLQKLDRVLKGSE